MKGARAADTSKKDRRVSLVENEFKKPARPSRASYLRAIPDSDHIILKRASLREFDKFSNDVLSFERKHDTELRAGTMVDRQVMETLRAAAAEVGDFVSELDFYDLNLAEIAKLMRIYLKPSNKSDFEYKLKMAVQFPEISNSYEMSITNFTPFFEKASLYVISFKRAYDFLALANRRVIPPCDMKPGGTLAVFIDKIPYEYGEAFLQAIGRRRFDDVENLLEEFTKQLQADRKEAKASRDLHLRFFSVKKGKEKPLEDRRKLHALASRLESEHVHEEEDDHSAAELKFQETVTVADGMEEEVENISAISFVGKPAAADAKKSTQIATHDKLGCQRMLFHGECASKSLCKFSHDKEVLSSMWKTYAKLMKESKFAPTEKLAAMKEWNFNNIISEVFQSINTNTHVLKAVYKNGVIKLPSGDLCFVRGLFDTGALCGNYIDKGWVTEHLGVLQGQLKSSKVLVTMADNKSVTQIDSIATL